MSDEKNYISVDGNGNIVLQDIKGNDININDIKKMKEVFENSEPEFIKQLYTQIDENFKLLVLKNKQQTDDILAILNKHIQERDIKVEKSKNIVTGQINAGGSVHIGDVIYNTLPKSKQSINIDEIKNLLANNQIEPIFEKLENYDVNSDSLTLIKAQWNDYKQQKMFLVLSSTEEITVINKIRMSILQLIKTIEQ